MGFWDSDIRILTLFVSDNKEVVYDYPWANITCVFTQKRNEQDLINHINIVNRRVRDRRHIKTRDIFGAYLYWTVGNLNYLRQLLDKNPTSMASTSSGGANKTGSNPIVISHHIHMYQLAKRWQVHKSKKKNTTNQPDFSNFKTEEKQLTIKMHPKCAML